MINSHKIKFFILFGLTTLILSGCVLPKNYHPKLQICVPDKHGCEGSAIERTKDYMMGFVEFDDQGWAWRDKQADFVIKQLKKYAAGENLLLIVFAHGWKNNADTKNADVQRMRDTLAYISSIEQKSTGDVTHKVAGVYLGWSGKSVGLFGAKELSFWERKKAAHKVGQGGVGKVILSLGQMVQNINEHKNKKRSISKLILIGHSMGGAVAYSAIAPHLMADFLKEKEKQQKPEKETENTDPPQDYTPVADLVILLNSALEARQVQPLIEVAKGIKGKPRLVILTADNDWATRVAFSAGRIASTLFEKYRADGDQKKADRRAIGHYEAYRTHYLKDIGDNKDKCKLTSDLLNKNNEATSGYSEFNQNIEFEDSKLKFIGKKGQEKSPVQVIYVNDRDVLNGHNGIECRDLIEFIREYIIFDLLVPDGSTH